MPSRPAYAIGLSLDLLAQQVLRMDAAGGTHVSIGSNGMRKVVVTSGALSSFISTSIAAPLSAGTGRPVSYGAED